MHQTPACLRMAVDRMAGCFSRSRVLAPQPLAAAPSSGPDATGWQMAAALLHRVAGLEAA